MEITRWVCVEDFTFLTKGSIYCVQYEFKYKDKRYHQYFIGDDNITYSFDTYKELFITLREWNLLQIL